VAHDPPGLGTYLAIMLTSTADTEVIMAARQLRKLMTALGIDAHDVAQAVELHGKLLEIIESAKTLKSERDHALTEIERLQRLQHGANGAPHGFAARLWQDTGMPTSVDNKTAQWLLDLAAQGRVFLTDKENPFVTSCATRRRLTDPMRDWLRDIVRHAIARTGEAPPP
jgi:hypothetical protein